MIMKQSMTKHLESEMKNIIQNHLSDLAEFTTITSLEHVTISEDMQHDLAALEYYCQIPCDAVTKEIYVVVAEAFRRLQHLLKLMDYSPDALDFRNTQLGRLWHEVKDWCNRVAAQFEISREDVWDCLAPAVPDVLVQLDSHVYEARWWKSAPKMDIEILLRTEHVIIEKFPYEPADLPGGIAVRFRIDGLYLLNLV